MTRLRRTVALVAAAMVMVGAPAAGLPASDEVGIGRLAYAAASDAQNAVAIASNGNGYLAVWEDGRAGDGATDVFATRLSPTGAVLDPTGIAIAVARNSQAAPDVAWDGTNYVVVWEDDREQQYETDIFAARVTPAGAVLDRVPIRVSAEPNVAEQRPSLASTGDGALVVWEASWSADADGGIQAAVIDADGGVGSGGPTNVIARAGTQQQPSVAAADNGYLVGWVDTLVPDGDTADIYTARVSESGAVLDTGGIAVGTAPMWEDSVNIASDGTDFLVSWTTRKTETFNADIAVRPVAANGTLPTTGPSVIAETTHDETGSALAWSGQSYLVTWTRLGTAGSDVTVLSRFVGADGTPATATSTVAKGPRGDLSSAVVWGGSEWVVTMSVDDDARARRVAADGSLLGAGTTVLSRAARTQTSPAIAASDDGFLAVWQEWNGTDYDIRAARLGPKGRVLDPGGIVVSHAAGDQTEPDVAWNGRRYQVVWTDARTPGNVDVYGTTVTPDGTVGRRTRLSLQEDQQYAPAVASNGRSFLVVWETIGRRPADVEGVVVRGGEPASPPRAISAARGDQGAPDVASDGTRYLVVWEDGRTDDFNIVASRVSGRGDVLDPAGLALTNAPRLQVLPTVAWNGAHYVAVWSDNRTATVFDVYGARVGTNGSRPDGDGFAVSVAPTWRQYPVVTRRGMTTFVAYERETASGSAIVGRRVRRTGAVDDAVVLSAVANSDERHPAMASIGAGTQLLYQRLDRTRSAQAVRVFGRRF